MRTIDGDFCASHNGLGLELASRMSLLVFTLSVMRLAVLRTVDGYYLNNLQTYYFSATSPPNNHQAKLNIRIKCPRYSNTYLAMHMLKILCYDLSG
jgi:hypothetical protein